MILRYFLLVCSLGLLGACASKTPVRPISAPLIAPAAVKKANLAPVEATAAKVMESNAVASEKVGRISRELSSLKIDLKEATAAADRLRKQKTATEAELQDNWQRLTAFEAAAGRAEQETVSARLALEDQRTLSEALQSELSQARSAVDAKNAEADSLRLTLTNTESLRSAAVIQADQNALIADEAKDSASKLSGEIRIYRIVGGILLIVIVILLALKFAKPL